MRIYTADKVLIGEYGEEHRNVLRFDEIPEVMRNAVLSAEDDRFYRHGGVDWMGVARAILTNVVKGSKSQGGSTITMQVARNFYLSSEKTYSRKFYELLLTFKIESELSKDEILALYMNQIYLGHRAYGFAAASRTYLGKPLSEVTPAEAAMLAGIPKAPSRFNPITNFARAEIRQHYVLNRMKALGYLTPEQTEEAFKQRVVARHRRRQPARLRHPRRLSGRAGAPADVRRVPGTDLPKGIDVYTTIDPGAGSRLPRGARRRAGLHPPLGLSRPRGPDRPARRRREDAQALDDILDGVQEKTPDSEDLLAAVVLAASPTEVTVARSARDIITISDKKALAVVARALNPKASDSQRLRRGSVVYIHKAGDGWEIINMPALQAALVSMAPQDGAIRAMIGGFDYNRGTFNRATQAWRQPGSNIKPFVYAAALERGLTPATQISDQPFMLTAEQTGSKAWSPKNDGNRYEPMLTLRQGLMRSKNMVSIRILQAIGPQYAQDYLTRFGFDKARWPAVLPLALGARRHAAAGRQRLQRVRQRRLPRHALPDRPRHRPLGPCADAGPARGRRRRRRARHRPAHRLGHGRHPARRRHQRHRARAHQQLKRNDVGGKTGTTNEAVDVWFSGFTPTLATTVWMGFDQPRSLGTNEFGSGLALSTWLDYMQPVLKGVPESKPAPRPDGLLVDNGEFYFSEFPPGQAVASLDLSSGDALTDFLNNNRSTGGVDNTVRPLSTPGAALPGAGQPGADRPPPDSPRSPSRTRRSRKACRPRRRWPSRCPCRRPALCRAGRRASPGQAPAGGDPAFPPIPVPRV